MKIFTIGYPILNLGLILQFGLPHHVMVHTTFQEPVFLYGGKSF